MSIEFSETMAGSFHLQTDDAGPVGGPPDERPMSFTIRARALATSLWGFLRRPQMEIEGEIDAEGFADHRHLQGTLGLDLLRTGTLPYAFRFIANDGAPYVFEGKKTVRAGLLGPSELAESLTVLPGSIRDAAGVEVGRALLRFDLRSDLVKYLRSFRLA